MAQPTPYVRQYDLTTYARANSAAPYNAAYVDAEFNAVAVTLSETLANLSLIQRDDGNLRMAIVTPDALDTATLNLIGEWTPRGPWLPSMAYAVRDMVTVDFTASYVCATAHTSDAFADDLALGYWQPVNSVDSVGVSSVQFTTNDVILGRATAGAGAGEEIVCTSAARSILDDATVAAIRTTLELGAASNPTFGNLTVANLVITGLTENGFMYPGPGGAIVSTVAPNDGQLFIGVSGGPPVIGSIFGTAFQVSVAYGPGAVTISLPQDIHTGARPTFANVFLTDHATGTVCWIGASSAVSRNANFAWDNTQEALCVSNALQFGAGSAPDAYIWRDAADTVAFRRTTNAQVTRFYRTYTDSSNYERLVIQSGVGYFDIAAETAGTGTDDISVFLVPCGTGAASARFTNGVAANIKHATTLLSAMSGATVTATNLIPDGAFVLGVVTRVTTTISNGGGTTGFQIGDGSDADRWGAINVLTAGTTSSNADATAAFTGSFIAANSVVITAVGGNFNGTGALRVTVMYIDLTPPGS